ncbi:MAG: hypothetical protein AB8B87_08220 [Granulosicoccus sp.]
MASILNTHGKMKLPGGRATGIVRHAPSLKPAFSDPTGWRNALHYARRQRMIG